MRLAKYKKIISGFILVIILNVVLFIFICPQNIVSSSKSLIGGLKLCESNSADTAFANNFGNGGGCFDFHLTIANQFIQILYNNTKLWFLVFFATFIIFKIYRPLFLKNLLINFFQHQYKYYIVNIRSEFKKNMMAWLSLQIDHDLA